MTMTVSLSKSKNQRKEVGRYAASSFSYSPLSLRSSGIDFMLIFRLENADRVETNLKSNLALTLMREISET